jgi:hypothetical protein
MGWYGINCSGGRSGPRPMAAILPVASLISSTTVLRAPGTLQYQSGRCQVKRQVVIGARRPPVVAAAAAAVLLQVVLGEEPPSFSKGCVEEDTPGGRPFPAWMPRWKCGHGAKMHRKWATMTSAVAAMEKPPMEQATRKGPATICGRPGHQEATRG